MTIRFYSGILMLFFVFTSCQKEGVLSFESQRIPVEKCAPCPRVEITVPVAVNHPSVAKDINALIEKRVGKILSFGEDQVVLSYQEAIKKFREEYSILQSEFPDEEVADWEASVNGIVSYDSPVLVSIKLDSYMYSGGAHGYGATTYLNFDKRTGEPLENWELFKNPDDFTAFAETKFRIQENIPSNVDINATGFMFDKEVFELPDNIGFTQKGLELIYNQYEIASYADGQKTLVLPYDELQNYLKIQ